jgi:hypothetical protein
MKFDSTFALAALTLLCGAFIFLIRSLFASKCTRFQVGWGCVDVVRDVDIELQDIRQHQPGDVAESRSRCPSEVDVAIKDESKYI